MIGKSTARYRQQHYLPYWRGSKQSVAPSSTVAFWQIVQMLKYMKTGREVKAVTPSQASMKIYVSMMNCERVTEDSISQLRIVLGQGNRGSCISQINWEKEGFCVLYAAVCWAILSWPDVFLSAFSAHHTAYQPGSLSKVVNSISAEIPPVGDCREKLNSNHGFSLSVSASPLIDSKNSTRCILTDSMSKHAKFVSEWLSASFNLKHLVDVFIQNNFNKRGGA